MFQNARAHGIDSVELRGITGEHVSPDSPPGDIEAVIRESRENGVPVLSVTAYTTFAEESDSAQRENEETLMRYVELAGKLGARYVRSFLYEPRHAAVEGRDGWDRLYDHMASSLNRVASAINGSPVKILLETHGRITCGKLMAPLLERIPSDQVGVLWDFPHSYHSGESIAESWALMGSRVGYLHVKDDQAGMDGKTVHRHVGEGEVPIKEVQQFLMQQGFKGTFCLEWERKWHPEMPPLLEALPIFTRYMNGH